MYSIIETTTDDIEIAKSISNKLISENLSPCIQIVDNIHSLFVWNGKLNDTNEILLRIKTHKDLIDEICSKVKKCIIMMFLSLFLMI